MVKKNKENSLSYLYLAILAFVTAIGIEVVSEKYAAFTLPEYTSKLTVSSVYILSAVFFIAFTSTVKISTEQKYILYLVVLALTFFRVITMLKGIAY